MNSVLVFLLLLSVIPTPCSAADPAQSETLPPVFVSSTRLTDIEEELFRVPGKVVVITAEEIEKLGAKTVQEVLQFQAGVTLFDSIGNEFQSTVDLRGFNAQPVTATSIFVDGVRVNEPDFNTINFDLVPIEDIEKIEISYGPGTVFGRNSMAGVLNITTKRGRKDKPHFAAEAGGGSFGRQKYTFATDGPLPVPNLDYYFSVTRELTDGFREASGGRITRLFGKLGYSLGQGTDITLSYTHVLDHLKQASSLTKSELRRDRNDNTSPGDFSDSDLHLTSLNVRQKLPAGFSVALNGFVRDNDIVSLIVDDFGNSRLRTDAFSGGGAVQATHEGTVINKKNVLSVGVEYSRNRFTSGLTFGGFPLAKKVTKEDVVGLYLLENFHVHESLIITGGFRYDWNRLDSADAVTPLLTFRESFHRLNPRGGVTYNPWQNLGFYFSYAQGFRTPTVDEFAGFLPPFFIASLNKLDPAVSQNFELGARWRVPPWFEGSVAAFYTPVKDEILFVSSGPLCCNGNFKKTLRRGIEFSLKGRYGKLVDGFLSYTVTKATFEANDILLSGAVEKGDELPLVPRHRVATGINLYPLDGLAVSLGGTYVGRQFILNDEGNNLNKLGDYFVLNGRLSYTWNNVTVFVSGNNLNNRKYSTFGAVSLFTSERFFVPAPGANVFAGISFRY